VHYKQTFISTGSVFWDSGELIGVRAQTVKDNTQHDQMGL